jgi:5-methylcytosine-specific restriction endonuclease McrA
MIIINCKYCGKEVKTYQSNIDQGRRYCSRECHNADRAVYKNCQNCGNEFKVSPYLLKLGYGIYCSRKCRNIGRLVKYPEIREINKRCFDKTRSRFRKENHPRWKGGIRLNDAMLRSSEEMKKWRRAVLKRDSFTCQDCGDFGHTDHRLKLHAHHIITFYENKELIYDVNNGITLCVKCHKNKHKKRIDSIVKRGELINNNHFEMQ